VVVSSSHQWNARETKRSSERAVLLYYYQRVGGEGGGVLSLSRCVNADELCRRNQQLVVHLSTKILT